MGRLLGRAAISIGSLGAIFTALIASGRIEGIWQATLIAVVAFYALAHLVPSTLFRFQSMPYTYQLRNNFGATGFELQNVTYAAYHTVWYNHVTHAAFPIEAWLWLVAASHWGGALGSAALLAVLCVQALGFGERRFGLGLCALWLLFTFSAQWAAQAWPAQAYQAAQYGLVGFGLWRFTGHFVEPLPPGVVGNVAFVPVASVARDPRILRAALLGYLSEFSAGLPFRLFNSWLFLTAQWLGYRPSRSLGWREANAVARRIHAEGWSAQPTTAALVHAARAFEHRAA